MVYRLFVFDKRSNCYQKKNDYKTKKMAETKAKYYIQKNREVKIVAIPTDELDIGLKIYLTDGSLYGEIIDEDESFWYIRRSFKGNDDKAFFLKDNFVEKFENGIFVIKED